VGDGCFIQCQTYGHSTRSSQTNQPMLEVRQTGTPALRLSTESTTTRLPQTAETARREHRVDSAGRPNGLRGTPPVSGRSPVGLADQNCSGSNSYCPTRTASASYHKRSWLARSIRTLEGSTPPFHQRRLIFRGLGDHATNGHRPAWLRPSMLGK